MRRSLEEIQVNIWNSFKIGVDNMAIARISDTWFYDTDRAVCLLDSTDIFRVKKDIISGDNNPFLTNKTKDMVKYHIEMLDHIDMTIPLGIITRAIEIQEIADRENILTYLQKSYNELLEG